MFQAWRTQVFVVLALRSSRRSRLASPPNIFGRISRRLLRLFLVLAPCMLLYLSPSTAAAQAAPGAIEQAYEQGVQFLTQEQWKSAATSFNEVLRADPHRADAENGLGVALGKLGDKAGSESAFRRATTIDPGYAEAHYNLALCLQEAANLDQAEAELDTAIKLRPDYEAAQLALALILQQQQDSNKAIALFKTVVQEDPRSAEVHNWLGLAYSEKNQLLGAVAEFQQAIDLNPEYVEALSNLASTFEKAQKFDDAVRVLRAAIAAAPNDAELHLKLSRALSSKGDFDLSLRELKAIQKNGDSAEVECEIARVLIQEHDFRGAADASEKALTLQPSNNEAYKSLGLGLEEQAGSVSGQRAAHTPKLDAKDHYDAGRQLLSQTQLQSAEQEFEKAVQADPNWAEAHNLLGFVVGQLGDLPAAIEHLHQATKLDPALASAHYNLGVALWYNQQRPESVSELKTAVELNPAFAEAYSFLGMTSRQTGDFDAGRRYLTRAISLNPDGSSPHVDLGIILLNQGQSDAAFEQFQWVGRREQTDQIPDLDLAIDAVQKAIKQRPNDPIAYQTLGVLLGKAGSDSQSVIEEFRKAIALRPGFAEAHNDLGLALVQTGDDQQAIKEFREAVRLKPDYAEAHANLGAVLTSNNVDESISELQRAVKLRPDLIRAQYNLAMAYLQKYGVDKGIEQLQLVIAMDANFAEAYYALGKALMQKGQIREAIAPLRQAVVIDPKSGRAHYQLGLALSRAQASDEGKKEIDAGLKLIADDERNRKANTLMATAKDEIEKGELQQAADNLTKVVQLIPEYAEGHLTLAQVLAKQDNLAASVPEFSRASELEPNSYAAQFGLGQVLHKQGKLPEAVAALRQAVSLRPSSVEANDELGLSLHETGDRNGAVAAFQKALQLDPSDGVAQENLDAIFKENPPAQIAEEKSRLRFSATPFQQTNELLPNVEDDLNQIRSFEAAIDNNEYEKLEPTVFNYLKQYPTSWRGYYIHGYIFFRMRKFGDSINELSRSLELNVANPEAHKILARDFMIIGKYDYAQTELQQAVRLEPESAEIHYSLGEVYSTMDMFKQAKPEFSAAIERDPTYAEAYNALGFSDEALGDDTGALESYKTAAQVAGQKGLKFEAPLVNLSGYYNRLNNPTLALEYAQKAIELNPKSDLAYYQMAKAHQSTSEWEPAAEDLRNAIAINSNTSQYYYVLAQVDRRLGNQKERAQALEMFQKLERDAQLVESRMNANRGRAVADPRN